MYGWKQRFCDTSVSLHLDFGRFLSFRLGALSFLKSRNALVDERLKRLEHFYLGIEDMCMEFIMLFFCAPDSSPEAAKGAALVIVLRSVVMVATGAGFIHGFLQS